MAISPSRIEIDITIRRYGLTEPEYFGDSPKQHPPELHKIEEHQYAKISIREAFQKLLNYITE